MVHATKTYFRDDQMVKDSKGENQELLFETKL